MGGEIRVKLRKIRKKKGFTINSFAKYIGISGSYYGQIELGIKNPSLKTALLISEKLNIDIKDLN